MDYEKKVLILMEKNPRLSAAYLAKELKVRMETAKHLVNWAMQYRAKDMFYLRTFGKRLHEIPEFIEETTNVG